MHHNAIKIYSKLLTIHYHDYNDIKDEEKEKMGEKYNSKNLLLKGQRFIEEENIAQRIKLRRQKTYDIELFDTSPSTDDSDEYTNIQDILALEGDEEEIKEIEGLKILTPNKLLTRLPI